MTFITNIEQKVRKSILSNQFQLGELYYLIMNTCFDHDVEHIEKAVKIVYIEIIRNQIAYIHLFLCFRLFYNAT